MASFLDNIDGRVSTYLAGIRAALVGCVGLLLSATALAEDPLAAVTNYVAYSEQFASSGQPTSEQLASLKQAGFERVVYIAYSDHENSLAHEDRIVKNLGMEYVHIPVEWSAPTVDDFEMFAGAMQRAPNKKTLLHCQVNYRASAFSFLYRVLYENVAMPQAKADMNEIWTPNETWRDLIFAVLDRHGRSGNCEGCDWSSPD